MKLMLIVSGLVILLLIAVQIYTSMASKKSETQPYKVIRVEKEYEIRYYPPALLAKVSSGSSTYGDLGKSGFRQLAQYIFGGNKAQKQIAMTTPVHMEISDSGASMAFVMPGHLKTDQLPLPNNPEIKLIQSQAETVAVLQFGGFSNDERINEHKEILKKLLHRDKIACKGNFRFLGYNPPYQLLGRKNEIMVTIGDKFGIQPNEGDKKIGE
jgi:hypothetical protein